MPKTRASKRSDAAPLVVTRSMAHALLRLYDLPDPRRPARTIRGYDRAHALRTARMCAAVAKYLGHPPARLVDYQIACLLHDVGRAGLDRRLFGQIWSWAKARGVPTRPREWRAVHPDTRYGCETDAFLKLYGTELEKDGIRMDRRAREQVEMRLGYAARLRRRLKALRPKLRDLEVRWGPWMEAVMLYYYYPERLEEAEPWVRELAEVLVACEQFEAYNNRQRGQDYYVRRRERLTEAFGYLEKLRIEGILSARVVNALRELAGRGAFDELLRQSRGKKLSAKELNYLRTLRKETSV